MVKRERESGFLKTAYFYPEGRSSEGISQRERFAGRFLHPS